MTRVVDVLELEAIDELEGQLLGVARLVDAHLAQHLADDDLDVLVVDGHALAAVDALDLLDEVALDGVPAAGLEVLLRVDGAVGDCVTGADLLAVLDQQLGVVRDGVLALDDILAVRSAALRRSASARPASGARISSRLLALPLQAGDDLVDLDSVPVRDEQLVLLSTAQGHVEALAAGHLHPCGRRSRPG